MEEDGIREAREGDQMGAGAVSGLKRYSFCGEAPREREDKVIYYGAQDIASSRDCDRAHAWGNAALQAARAQSSKRSAVVVGRQPASLFWENRASGV